MHFLLSNNEHWNTNPLSLERLSRPHSLHHLHNNRGGLSGVLTVVDQPSVRRALNQVCPAVCRQRGLLREQVAQWLHATVALAAQHDSQRLRAEPTRMTHLVERCGEGAVDRAYCLQILGRVEERLEF